MLINDSSLFVYRELLIYSDVCQFLCIFVIPVQISITIIGIHPDVLYLNMYVHMWGLDYKSV